MSLRIASALVRSLFDDFLTHLTPKLQRLARDHVPLGVDDIEPRLQKLEQKHGRDLLKLDTRHGSWRFIRSIMLSTKPHLWRAMVYMVITTAAAAPALLIEQVMTHFEAIKAVPWKPFHVALLLAFPLVICLTNVTFMRYLKAFSQKWFRLDPACGTNCLRAIRRT